MVPSIGQIDLFKNYLNSIGAFAKNKSKKKKKQQPLNQQLYQKYKYNV